MRDVLRLANFRRLFLGLIASMVGESVLLLALAIWVKDITGRDGLAGAVLFAIAAPMVLAPLVGWLVDRFRRRPFFVAANLVTAALLTPLLTVEGRSDLWIIYLVAALYGLSYLAVDGSLQGLITLVVPAERLAEANGALQTVKQGLRLGGPLAGAGLYTMFGGGALVAVAATGFVIAALAAARLRVPESAPPEPELRWFGEVSAGVRHLHGEPALRRLVTGVILAVLVIGLCESLIFAYVDRGLGRQPGFVGVLVCVQGIGGLLGGLISAAVIRRVGELAATAAGLLAFAAGGAALAYPTLAVGLPAMAVAGLGLPLMIVGYSTLMQRRTPAPLLGRVSAASDALFSIPQAVSIGAGAILVSVIDYRILFVLMAIGLALAAAYVWAGRRLSSPPTVVADPGVTPLPIRPGAAAPG